MKNILKIGGSIAISVVLGMFIVLINLYLIKLDMTMAYIIGGIVGAIIGYLIYRIENALFNVFRITVLSWSMGILVGLAYIAIFDPNAAQGIFLPIFWTGPIAGVNSNVVAVTYWASIHTTEMYFVTTNDSVLYHEIYEATGPVFTEYMHPQDSAPSILVGGENGEVFRYRKAM